MAPFASTLPNDPDEGCDEDIAGAVECGVAAKTYRQRLSSTQAEVIAATVGANTPPRTAMMMSATNTTEGPASTRSRRRSPTGRMPGDDQDRFARVCR